MWNTKKRNFWRLAFLFTSFAVLVLVMLWSSPRSTQAPMMDQNMGSMMKQMHVARTTIYELLQRGDHATQMDEMHSHHQSQAKVIFQLNYLSTALIFLLLPLIIGGSIILAIVWIK